MKDVAGRPLKPGDKVATTRDGYTYALCIGEVVDFTPKKVKIKFPVEKDRLKYYPDGYETALKFPEQLCLIT